MFCLPRNMYKLVCIVAAVGAINWGMIGFFGVDLVARLVDMFPMAAQQQIMFGRILYCLVGLAGLFSLGCVFGVAGCAKK